MRWRIKIGLLSSRRPPLKWLRTWLHLTVANQRSDLDMFVDDTMHVLWELYQVYADHDGSALHNRIDALIAAGVPGAEGLDDRVQTIENTLEGLLDLAGRHVLPERDGSGRAAARTQRRLARLFSAEEWPDSSAGGVS
ncbi:hypothetical protein HD597_012887 [Nonomuraea thailandensis]|uniref:Uncharacterized protein n=1 Tax=Nonomuraea thailandensis TaxID=1188745 RepID=A0A9X2KA58_9ACTN|nr:hypothetical protein [Nonomuraea thailandensis]MCP2365783.1 hypothetical protein [Nonomuraea thailandensis]